MSLNPETPTTLTGIERVNATAAHIESLPQDMRGEYIRADALVHAIAELFIDRNPITIW